jgi:hypothetical protein
MVNDFTFPFERNEQLQRLRNRHAAGAIRLAPRII